MSEYKWKRLPNKSQRHKLNSVGVGLSIFGEGLFCADRDRKSG